VSVKFQIHRHKENALQQFTAKYQDQISGVLNGFDRLVFRGSLRRLNYGQWDQNLGAMVAHGMEQYLWQNQILFKDYAEHVKGASERLKRASLQPFEEQKLPVNQQFEAGLGRTAERFCPAVESGSRKPV
jgi:hypothetical protein